MQDSYHFLLERVAVGLCSCYRPEAVYVQCQCSLLRIKQRFLYNVSPNAFDKMRVRVLPRVLPPASNLNLSRCRLRIPAQTPICAYATSSSISAPCPAPDSLCASWLRIFFLLLPSRCCTLGPARFLLLALVLLGILFLLLLGVLFLAVVFCLALRTALSLGLDGQLVLVLDEVVAGALDGDGRVAGLGCLFDSVALFGLDGDFAFGLLLDDCEGIALVL